MLLYCFYCTLKTKKLSEDSGKNKDITVDLNQTETLVQKTQRCKLQCLWHLKGIDYDRSPAKALAALERDGGHLSMQHHHRRPMGEDRQVKEEENIPINPVGDPST